MNKVVHCKKEKYDIYIGRPSKWGNPFSIGIDGDREEVLKKYRDWIGGKIDLPKHHWYQTAFPHQPPSYEEMEELKGKILGCWCHPKRCHGDILIELLGRKKYVEEV